MRKSSSISCAIFFTLLLTASLLTPSVSAADKKNKVTKQPPVMTKNPLLSESTLPYHYPPFDQIKDEYYEPAYMQGMAEELKEVEAIAANKEKSTFDNTIVALERSGRTLARVDHVFSNLSGANTNEAIQKIETALAPKLSAHQDAIHLNSGSFFIFCKGIICYRSQYLAGNNFFCCISGQISQVIAVGDITCFN